MSDNVLLWFHWLRHHHVGSNKVNVLYDNEGQQPLALSLVHISSSLAMQCERLS
jgi:hypothetical protein